MINSGFFTELGFGASGFGCSNGADFGSAFALVSMSELGCWQATNTNNAHDNNKNFIVTFQ
jgi:hypothetical protein